MKKSSTILSCILGTILGLATLFYWIQLKDGCVRVPLRRLSHSQCFYLDGAVGNEGCLLRLHLGGNYEFWLSKKMIDSIPHQEAGFAKYSDENDREVEEPLYKIPEMTIGELKIKNGISRVDEHDFSPGFPVSDFNRSYRIGEVGSKILERTNMLLDIPRQCLYFTNSMRVLKRKGYDMSQWLVVPFEKAKSGVKIEVETDMGKKSFILFTSASHVLLKTSAINQERVDSGKFMIQNIDFGPLEILSYDIPHSFPADGLIGLSFLQNRAFYIDYSQQRLYIQTHLGGNCKTRELLKIALFSCFTAPHWGPALSSMCPNGAPNVDLKGPSDPARRLKIIDFSEPGSLLPPPTKIGNQRVSEAKKSQRLAFRMTKPIAEGAGVEEGSIFQSRSQPMVFYFCGR